jgi:ribulose bisphosphate carboxylase small subunit
MHLIYTRAKLTVIAAARRDEYLGLVGVDGTSRRIQFSTVVNRSEFISTLHHHSNAVSESQWNTGPQVY